jgi:hypothetical protein
VNAFNDLAKDQTGRQTLLEGKIFDQSVASIQTIYVQPGEAGDVSIDRAQGSRWVGIAAGYYGQVTGRPTSSLMPIPYAEDVVLGMRINLVLGKDAIHFVESTREPAPKT